ncbi:hypothetical protein BN940_15326 [Castellaniella defragrans 65Phen]|uniref:Uncharacterized protein n=1 Tax=Castellaniella defragrans (strain DSM 12143 / CCUG 39792 / 65Phen) TaxID=1437824 RepID=W8X0R5_CASD6|nr:hypothetical protein BN940_15326 [Castellaniella defragrans 65Phen]
MLPAILAACASPRYGAGRMRIMRRTPGPIGASRTGTEGTPGGNRNC